ncbi:aldehyde dehydrogenase family protein [Schumannella sp. 10F1B-5-1]|uniref:aldehyde dehydrogenase family protein n=1 Tax=Schumannella sp. 10F1B-5-1 TaxID=2590780 RepID=UPI0011322A87|nr:aldehyde dehydrogenase family protein [Schumannella sp. 10F1B-5-1]TPW72238.1 aldehyde dehydrogenase family protein [Schumannella sp. 10F1B-5-1]
MSFLEYAPAPESTSVLKLKDAYGLFIDGEFVGGGGAAFDTISPATGRRIATVATADAGDIDRAVAAARRAYDGTWSRLSGRDRGKYLFRIARLVQERARELAVAESLDNGKPIKETRDFDIPTVAAWFFYYAGWADKLDHAGLGPAPRSLGVAAQVIPWNFPLMMLAWKIAPALAAGNTVVIKPAETTPLTALIFAEILQQADLPAGVVNIVTGAGETGAALVAHPGVDKVAFTGSTAVGKRIAQTIAGQGKKLTLELGGKGANIVFDDAPLEQAIEGIVNGIFFNQGQVCCAGSRLLVQESVHDEVVERLRERMRTLRVGDPLDKNTDVGAINSAEQLQRITALTEAGIAEGAEAWSPDCELPSEGFWFRPTLLTNVATSNTVARDEIFGPVLSILTFRTPAEAVAKANNSPYGLSAGIWSEKGSRTLALADKLKAGVIWSNTFNKFDPASPFGGYKESGYGREGGRQGIGAYLQAADAPAPARSQAALDAASGATTTARPAVKRAAKAVAKTVTKPAAKAAAKPAKTSTRKAAK